MLRAATGPALCALLLALPGPGRAEGFAVDDLTTLSPDLGGYKGGRFAARTGAERVTLSCEDCEGLVAVDVLLGRSTDGTEGRYRDGTTTLQSLEDQCKAREPSCRLFPAEAGGAVGWRSEYRLGDNAGSTVVLFRDGDLLTIRAIAPDMATASANARRATETLGRQIAGP